MYYTNEQKIDATSMLKSNNALQESQTMCCCSNQRACKSHWKVGYKVVAYIKSVPIDGETLQMRKESTDWVTRKHIGSS
jgi:hypothetical protein